MQVVFSRRLKRKDLGSDLPDEPIVIAMERFPLRGHGGVSGQGEVELDLASGEIEGVIGVEGIEGSEGEDVGAEFVHKPFIGGGCRPCRMRIR